MVPLHSHRESLALTKCQLLAGSNVVLAVSDGIILHRAEQIAWLHHAPLYRGR